ncbi:hypothetical protein ACO2Q3_22900 [Caulobacter sp. KR2-114]|uniref:hypothetical protein n=1 Tax=Caulobacter sp. KR2-114 TaxID=3400912 RepID=UPI003C00872E
MRRALAAAALIAAVPSFSVAHEASQELCKAMLPAPSGGGYVAATFPGLRLVGRLSSAPLPPPPAGTALVECGRDAITPTLNDVRVLTDYHLPLSITDGERVAFLEVDKGQVVLRMAQGDLTPQELREVRARLDALQLAFNASGAASGQAHRR